MLDHNDRRFRLFPDLIDQFDGIFAGRKIKVELQKLGYQVSLRRIRKYMDVVVAEATYKIIKTEFAFNRIFEIFEELETELFDYVNWYNNFRIHSSLDYLTPVEYRVVNDENV